MSGAFAYEEAYPAEPPMGEDVSHEQMASMMTSYLASLPPERFPNILQMVDRVMTAGSGGPLRVRHGRVGARPRVLRPVMA